MSLNRNGQFDFRPLSRSNWRDFEKLFGARGACGGCWCMHWRLSNKAYEAGKGNANKQKIKELVKAGEPLGIIAYYKAKPIGWCSVSPRRSLKRLETSRYFKQVDRLDVWSISCLYILQDYRRKGLSAKLVREACDYAKQLWARVIESYPIVPIRGEVPEVFAWVGFAHTFEQIGFELVKQPSKSRLYMRYYLDPIAK